MGQSIAGVTSNNNFQMQNSNVAILSNPNGNFMYQVTGTSIQNQQQSVQSSHQHISLSTGLNAANQSLIINQQQIQQAVNPLGTNSGMIISGVNSQQRQFKQSVLGIPQGVSQIIPPLQSQALQQNQNSPGINQTALRFQLNTKRFSNAKEQPFAAQTQLQSHSQPHTSQFQPILQNTFQQSQPQNQPLNLQLQPTQPSQMRNHNNARIAQKASSNQMMINVSTNMHYSAGDSISNYNAQLLSSSNQNSLQQQIMSNQQQNVYLKPTTSPTNLSKTMSQFPSQQANSLILSNNSNSTTNTTANQYQNQQHQNVNYKILQPTSQKILLQSQNQNSQLQNYHQQQIPILLQQNPSSNQIVHSSSNLHNQLNIVQNSSGLEFINDFSQKYEHQQKNQQMILVPQIENFNINDINFSNNVLIQHTKKSSIGASNLSQNLNLQQQTSENQMLNSDIQLKKHQLQSNMHPMKVFLNTQQFQNTKQNENRPQSQNNRIQSQPPQSSSITYSQPSNLINNKLNKATSFQLAHGQNQINQTPQQETKVKLVFSQNNQLSHNQSSIQNSIRTQNIQQLQQSQTQNQFQQSVKNINQQFNISQNTTQQQPIIIGKVQIGNPIQVQSLGVNNAQQNKILTIKTIQLQYIKLANNGQNLGIMPQEANQNSTQYQYNSQLGINNQQSQQNTSSITQIQSNSQNVNQNFMNTPIQQSNVNSQINNLQQQKQLSLIRASTHQQNTIKFIKNQLSHISKLMEEESGEQQESYHVEGSAPAVPPFHLSKHHENIMSDKKNINNFDGQHQQMYHQQHSNVNKIALGQMGHLIDQDDDQESMMSDQFNTSNESMFKVRGVSTIGGGINGGYILGGGLNAGDSTYRCNESAQDDDRGLISESEDGWYPDKDNIFRHEQQAHENFNDISEHSSDEQTDSDMDGDGANNNKDNIPQIKKIKKNKGDKGEKKKKKKKKGQDQQQLPIELNEAPIINMQQAIESKKIFQTYKILQDSENEKRKIIKQVSQDSKIQQKQGNTNGGNQKDDKKITKNNVMGKDSLKDQSIKVNIQVKKNDKQNENQSTLNAMNQNKNQFNSPNVKIGKLEKLQSNQQTNIKQSQTANQTNKKEQNFSEKNNNNQPQKSKNDDFTRALQILELQKMPTSSTNTNSVQGQLLQSAATPLKKPKKNTFKLQALNHALPKNLQECYDRFFESGFKINPQFEYENNQSAQKFLEQFVEPDGQYLEISKRILDSFLKEYGSETNYLAKEGKILNQDETHQYIKDYLQNLGVEEWIQINFQKNQVAPTSVTHDPKTGKCKMNIKLPCEYREGRMIGVLDHEIGTHFLRKHNEKMQQWYKKREKFDMKTCIATEEGLACTNQMIQTVKEGNCKPFMYRSALNYYAAFMAKELSFVELFKALERYVETPQSRWKFCLRVKRGLTDTSMKGGLYKDQVYLEGAIKVLQQRTNLNFKGLLCGKISLEDINREQISSILNYEGQLLPLFMEDMDEYMRSLDVIAQCNHIDDVDNSNIIHLPIEYNNQEEKVDDNFEQIDDEENPSEQSADQNNLTNNQQFLSNTDLPVKSEETTPNQRNHFQENQDNQNVNYSPVEHANAI